MLIQSKAGLRVLLHRCARVKRRHQEVEYSHVTCQADAAVRYVCGMVQVFPVIWRSWVGTAPDAFAMTHLQTAKKFKFHPKFIDTCTSYAASI